MRKGARPEVLTFARQPGVGLVEDIDRRVRANAVDRRVTTGYCAAVGSAFPLDPGTASNSEPVPWSRKHVAIPQALEAGWRGRTADAQRPGEADLDPDAVGEDQDS